MWPTTSTGLDRDQRDDRFTPLAQQIDKTRLDIAAKRVKMNAPNRLRIARALFSNLHSTLDS